LSAYLSFSSTGLWTYAAVVYAFGIIPVLDVLLGTSDENLHEDEENNKKVNPVFDLMLYINLPIVFVLLYYFFNQIDSNVYSTSELIGLSLSAGILLATNAINVAHELCHRKNYFEKFIGKMLFMPCLYMHFYIEHNYGHHIKVATPDDGATAKYNQSVYNFWFTSTTKQYVDAWKKQMELLKMKNLSFFSIKNDMLWYHIIQPVYLLGVFALFSTKALVFAIIAGVIAFLFLECINYIEHYGLMRKKINGKYEKVQNIHSWNSDHVMGRIVLYELTRHSDHHFRASKKYQVLESLENSPTMPFGYPGSMLLATLPPLWYTVMHPKLQN
jgi:alkane 1-monooxygenase